MSCDNKREFDIDRVSSKFTKRKSKRSSRRKARMSLGKIQSLEDAELLEDNDELEDIQNDYE